MNGSNISWTDHTFNAWIGCAKVSPGCANCYAAEQNKLRKWTAGGEWGKERRRTSAEYWKGPLKWNKMLAYDCPECGGVKFHPISRDAVECGCLGTWTRCIARRPRVFCASLADWLDEEVPVEWLVDLLGLIHQCGNMDWQLLTKRPENLKGRMEGVLTFLALKEALTDGEVRASVMAKGFLGFSDSAAGCLHNVWVGVTVENQEYAERRIPVLLGIPAAVRFLSVEPMLGAMDFESPAWGEWFDGPEPWRKWVICGGESGPGRRGFEVEWAEELWIWCRISMVPFFMKQDGHLRSGQQGRVPDKLWGRKEFPKSFV